MRLNYFVPRCSSVLNTLKHNSSVNLFQVNCKLNLPCSGRMVLKRRGNLWNQSWIPNSYIFRKETVYPILIDCTFLLTFWVPKQSYFKKMSHCRMSLKNFISVLIYLFLVALDFCCCTWAFFGCSEQGLPFTAVHGLLLCEAQALGTRASAVVACGLSSCGTRLSCSSA